MKIFIVTLLIGLGTALNIHQQQQDWFHIIVDDELIDQSSFIDQGPPPYYENARMARYVVHNSEWTAMATISIRDKIKSYPMANVFSVSDGSSVDNSSGIPYFYLSALEISVHDLNVDNRASITMSLAQGSYCKSENIDPEDPRCAHVILTGKIVKLDSNSEEGMFAKDALFTRHPAMDTWPEDHGWFFAKLDIENIMLLDFFGGVKTIQLEDYLNASPY